jgi:hypothetical protein
VKNLNRQDAKEESMKSKVRSTKPTSTLGALGVLAVNPFSKRE